MKKDSMCRAVVEDSWYYVRQLATSTGLAPRLYLEVH